MWTLAFSCNQNLQRKMQLMEKPANIIEQEKEVKEVAAKKEDTDQNNDSRRKVKEKEKEEQKSDKRSKKDNQGSSTISRDRKSPTPNSGLGKRNRRGYSSERGHRGESKRYVEKRRGPSGSRGKDDDTARRMPKKDRKF